MMRIERNMCSKIMNIMYATALIDLASETCYVTFIKRDTKKVLGAMLVGKGVSHAEISRTPIHLW
jgi:hypothetical protein